MDGGNCDVLVVKTMMPVSKVICFGEALIDMLSNRIGAKIDNDNEIFTKFAGGAPANVSVALAKLGGNSYFCGMLGRDPFGDFLYESLQKHNVKMDYVLFTEKAKTALAFVSLDNYGERTFSFYRPPAADLCFTKKHFSDTWFTDASIFHFCSNSLTEYGISEATKAGIAIAKKHNALISFDVNLRLNLWAKDTNVLLSVWSCISDVDVLKVSQEELLFLCGEDDEPTTVARILQLGCQLIVISDGGNPLRWITRTAEGSIKPPQINMLDATAAGDAFVGGLLFKLHASIEADGRLNSNLVLKSIVNNETELCKLLKFASACGAHAASKYGAFPSLPSLLSLQTLTREINYDIS